jgi:hypothetical protein
MDTAEIADLFPNGLHDAEVESVHIDQAKQTITMTVYVWVGSLEDPGDDREPYRRGRLEFRGVRYCAMDAPDERDVRTMPFTGRFWVDEWNGFLHVAALEVAFSWAIGP